MSNVIESDVFSNKDINTLKPFYIPEIKLTKESKLFREIINKFGLSKNVLKISNYWIESGQLENDLKARHLELPFGTITFDSPIIHKPMHDVNSKREILTPKIARDKNMTYASKLTVNLNFKPYKKFEDKNPAFTVENIDYGEIPIMLGSKYCHLYGKTPKEKIDMGECPNDPLSYFIIKGTEKTIIIQEKLRSQQIVSFINTKGDIDCRLSSYSFLGSSLK